MTVFLLIGILFTLLVAGGGGVAWWWLGRQTPGVRGKRRHREEARQLQERFEQDEDFTRNFHRPTQNELLETLQALDHLTLDWQFGDADLVDYRFKNELAESFPALCKERCRYPEPLAEDLSRLFGKGKLSAEAMEERQRTHFAQVMQKRAVFHAARAQANAHHQLTSGPAAGPVALPPGSLPFRVREAAPARRRSTVGGVAVAALVMGCLAAGGWYVMHDAGLRQQLGLGAEIARAGITAPASLALTPSPQPAPAATTAPGDKVAVPDGSPSSAPAGSAPTPAPVATEPAVVQSTTPTQVIAPLPAQTPSAADVLAQQVEFSKQRAIEKHPDLAVPNSEINSRFIFRYKRLVEEKSERLQDPAWPEKLAEECAAAATSPKPHKVTQPSAGRS